MTGTERGFLLLTSHLGDPARDPLTVAQLRTLSRRVQSMDRSDGSRELEQKDLICLGYSKEDASRILALLSEEDVLEDYLRRGSRNDCVPLIRGTSCYPSIVRIRLGLDSPGCLWSKGNPDLLKKPCVALVGSRELHEDNQAFAEEVGRQAALQGLVLVSGNAKGADRIAQEACLASGGSVISVVADRLQDHPLHPRMLFLSEDGFDLEFTPLRALSRNRVIHCLPGKTFVAQCTYEKGGTWDGTTQNLRHGWSSVFCYADGSQAIRELVQRGAVPITGIQLADIRSLQDPAVSFFDETS